MKISENLINSQKFDLKMIQDNEKEILKTLIYYLESNNLKYYLIGGTLLGAVRHKGFIPWDDDIDIAMSRKDYEKLICLLKKNKNIGPYVATSSRLKNGYYPFIKIVNQNIMTYSKDLLNKYQMNLWVDIFPIDKLPNGEALSNKLFKKVGFYRSIYFLKTFTYSKLKAKSPSSIKRIIKFFVKTILIIIPIRYISNKIDRISKSYFECECDYSGGILWGYGLREKLPNEVFEKVIRMQFEDIKAYGLQKYDAYLSSIYGDYMQLPPEEKRITHSFEAWRVTDEKK